MSWKRRKKYKGKYEHYSVSRVFRKQGKSNDEFEIMLSNLPLEDIIALKMEISSRSMNNRLYGIPIWRTLGEIVKEAVFKFAFSSTRTQREAMNLIGIEEIRFYEMKKKYGINRFFDE
tara:strand:+ start:399 stop:752 length:354 start_codon:yes stop_codon:yes gene_type:complete